MSSRKKRRKKRKSPHHGVSAVQPKKKVFRNDTYRQTSGKSRMASSGSADEIKRLISNGKSKAAVSKAKLFHKSLGTNQSEMILVDAYAARIREMIANGYIVEAETLLELVRGRYNTPDHFISELNGLIAARAGRIDDLVGPLADSDITSEQRAAIEKIIKNELVDLTLLARCEVLPSDHSLKTAALAVAEAFTRVTSGYVEEAEIALPAISHRNPLAPWKMFIKALFYFYRHDEEKCEKYLQAIDVESAPGRLVPLMREMLAGKSSGNHTEKSLFLIDKVIGNSKKIRDSLQKLDNALAANKPSKLFKAIRNTVKICDRTCPELVDKLKQHIAIRSWMLGVEAKNVNRALGGPSLKNAYFWRLHARAAEMKGNFLWACAMLEEFRKHALYEGWFSEKSKEASVVYLHMADLLKRLPVEDFEWLQSEFESEFRGFESYYHNQPRFILEAVGIDAGSQLDTYFLYPEHLYSLANEIMPTADTFRQWLEWVENYTSHWKKCDAVALDWHAALPEDTRPLLYLMKSAEKRNALKKAIGYLDTAERIDGLNPDVKRARLRLLVAIAVRHLKQKKTHLAQKDILAIEHSPQSREGDRPAFVAALKSVSAMIDENKSELVRWKRELTTLLEYSLAAKVILQGLSTKCGLPDRRNKLPTFANDQLEGNELVTAMARGCKLADDMGIVTVIPPEYEKKLRNFFTAPNNSVDPAAIRIIAETALRNDHFELAYAAAGAGLIQQGGATARFLLLRARSLPLWEVDRQSDCLAAAIEFARRERDMDLIDEAIELRRVGNGMPFGFSIFDNIIGEGNFSLEAEELNEILQVEKEAREYPSFMPDEFFNEFDDDDDDSQCRHCDAKNCPNRDAPYRPDKLYAEDSDVDDDDIDDSPDFNVFLDDFLPDLPPELMSLIMKVYSKHGKNGSFPDPEELARKDPWLADQLIRELLEAEADGTLPDPDRDWFPGYTKLNRR